MNMKKISKNLLKILFAFLLVITMIPRVNAQSAYYTNSKGVVMTQSQYEFLASMYSETKIDNFSQDQFNRRVYADVHTTEDVYVIEEQIKDPNGNLLDTNVMELTEEEYRLYKENSESNIMPATANSVTTSEVKMTLQVYTHTASQSVSIDLSTRWLNGAPSVKSFDVSAFRFTTTSNLQLSRFDAEGYQDSDAGSVVYSNEGGNSMWETNAYGTSMNILDNANNSLTLEIGAEYYYFGSGTLRVTGTYQHATRNVTLAQSQSYNFSANGCGGVVEFYNNVGNYYNSNPGVSLSHSL